MPSASSFPFIGSRLEVLNCDGVRYRGQLSNIDSVRKSITLIKVHHYGSEGRRVDGFEPQAAKGSFPPGESRTFPIKYVEDYRVLLDDDGEDIHGGETASSDGRDHHPIVIAGASGNGSSNNNPDRQVLAAVKDADGPNSISRPVVVAEVSVNGVDNSGHQQEAPASSNQAGRKRTGAKESSNCGAAKKPRRSGVMYRVEEGAIKPLYFISQVKTRGENVGVLLNQSQCPEAPVFTQFSTGDTEHMCVENYTVSQIWDVTAYEWKKFDEVSSAGIGRSIWRQESSELPLRADWLPCTRSIVAMARAQQAQLIHNAYLETHICRAVTSLPHFRTTKDIEVDVEGLTSPSRRLVSFDHLPWFHSERMRKEGIQQGDRFDVQLIKLPKGYLMGEGPLSGLVLPASSQYHAGPRRNGTVQA